MKLLFMYKLLKTNQVISNRNRSILRFYFESLSFDQVIDELIKGIQEKVADSRPGVNNAPWGEPGDALRCIGLQTWRSLNP